MIFGTTGLDTHASSQVLSLLSNELGVDSPYKANKVDVCDICLCARQTRNQFFISESIANDPFELIDCDICGSYKIPSFCGVHYFLKIVDGASRAVWIYLMKGQRGSC